MKIPQDDMIAVLKATDGDIDAFLQNWDFSMLLVLYFRQLIAFDKNDKVIVF